MRDQEDFFNYKIKPPISRHAQSNYSSLRRPFLAHVGHVAMRSSFGSDLRFVSAITLAASLLSYQSGRWCTCSRVQLASAAKYGEVLRVRAVGAILMPDQLG